MSNIPEKPKRPNNAYFRYKKDHYTEFKKENEGLKGTDLNEKFSK